jgi:rhomboid protease GluP
MCPHCRAFITTDDRVCPYCNTPVGPRAVDRRNPGEIMGGLIPHARFTTILILLINTGLYLATALYSMKSGRGSLFGIDIDTLYQFGAKYPPAIVVGHQWWRLVTAGFLHGGLLHILMNSWVLFDLGAQVEEFYGTARLIIFYFAATVLGFYASMFWTPAISVGASAGLMGLIGAMIAFGMRERSHYGSALRGFYVRWALYGLALGFLLPGIDNAAHLGGLAAGFVAGFITGPQRLVGWTETLWRIVAGICIALTAYSFLRMVLFLTHAPAGQ